MDQEHPEKTGEITPAAAKAEWMAPQVDELVAGRAEASAGSDVEGLDGLS